jgi:hypothetical protein
VSAVAVLLALQTLTNLGVARPGTGLPSGWSVERVRGVAAPAFHVRDGHVLRVETHRAAGVARYRLRAPVRPAPRPGVITWRWRTDTPLRGARLKTPTRDDAPIRLVVVFDDGRTITYSWGLLESRGESFAGTRPTRMNVVLQTLTDADGSWHVERRDPFTDYRRLFNRAPHPIIAIGIGADTDQLGGKAVAEVADLVWEGP